MLHDRRNCGYEIGGEPGRFNYDGRACAIAPRRKAELARKPRGAERENPKTRSDESRTNGRNNFHVIAAIRARVSRAGTEEPVSNISAISSAARPRSRSNELICAEDRQQFAGNRGGGQEKYRGGRGPGSAEELKTASKINSRPLIQNTYSTCDTFAV